MSRDVKEVVFYICAAAVFITLILAISAYCTDRMELNSKNAYNNGYEEGYDKGYEDGFEAAKENWNIQE